MKLIDAIKIAYREKSRPIGVTEEKFIIGRQTFVRVGLRSDPGFRRYSAARDTIRRHRMVNYILEKIRLI